MMNQRYSFYLLLLAAGCGGPVADDNGDESFVRQAVPVLQGRKVRGHAEVKLLSDLTQLRGRETLVRALMRQPEFVEHWSEVLADDLHVDREGPRAQTSCYGDPLRAGPPDEALALDVLGNGPTTPLSPAFNMSDVLRSALVLDNVYPLYSAHLFALQNKPGIGSEQNKRSTVGTTFGHVYLNRDLSCVGCHNSEYSASGESTGWDRTFPVRGYFEAALYGSSYGTSPQSAFAVFRTDALQGGAGSDPFVPWNMNGCGAFDQTLPDDSESANFAGLTGKQRSIRHVRTRLALGYLGLAADGLDRMLPPDIQDTCDFCAQSCDGVTLDLSVVANAPPTAAQVKALFTTADLSPSSGTQTCRSGCHENGTGNLFIPAGNDWANDMIGVTSSKDPTRKIVAPGDSANSVLVAILEGSVTPQMPLGGQALTAAQLDQVKDWIDALPPLSACDQCATTDCSQPHNYVSSYEAFAFLTAANVVNNVWAEAMGSPLTIGNYFPRNSSEHQLLRDLTEYEFIPQEWSIRTVLARALTSALFNRAAPGWSPLSEAYVIPPVFDPWIVADPREPPVSEPGYDPLAHREAHFNAMGERLYRYSARNLLSSVQRALDWPAPRRFPNGNYPSADLARAIGQYFSESSAGSQATDLGGLLYWENVHGACAKPAGVPVDWLDRLVTAINAHDPADPAGPLTVGDVVVVMRDWLLGHGTVSSTNAVGLAGSEAQALSAYFGVADLAEPIGGVGDLPAKLRGYCGVLLETPHFMLAGIAPQGPGPEPRLRVCNAGPCTYQELCEELAGSYSAELENEVLICGTDWVSVLPVPNPPDEIWRDWCIGPGCGLLVDFVPEGCFTQVLRGSGACPVAPPACDVRNASLGLCGGPPSATLRGRGERPLVVAWAEGVSVDEAQGVKIRPSGTERFVDLRVGTVLRYGDLLAVPEGASLRFSGRYAEIATPRGGVPRGTPGGMFFLSITGEESVRRQDIAEHMRGLPQEELRWVDEGWGKRGEAGMPLSYEDYQTYELMPYELPAR